MMDRQAGHLRNATKLGYLVTEYPKPSHSFIRREILALEAMGWSIHRIAIRPIDTNLVDPQDVDEGAKTHQILGQPVLRLLWDATLVKLRHPVRWCRALAMMCRMWRANDRGFIRHVAYLVEAAHLVRHAKRNGIRHVHVHFAANGANVARLSKCLGGPTYSMTVHGPSDFDAPVGQDLAGKVKDAEFIAVISAYCGAQVKRWTDEDLWTKLNEVHCAVNDVFLQGPQPIPPKSSTLICIGRLAGAKLQPVLIDALAKVRDAGVDCRLVLAGDGELRPLIERRVQEHELTDQVEITGWIPESEVLEQLLASRALVLASAAEGLPVVIMESLSVGRPVISTPVAGIPELVAHGEHGWLVPAGDIEGLAEAMIDVMQTPIGELERMGAAGAARIEERHRASTEAAKLDQLFKRILRPSGAGEE